ncbi:VTT domain-containing protein [Tumidithrix elongata RA019]|uniref:TVP38/TMEM64 family membrane protein n=1 Tax=Tumidithrix elongata BACA0141 TaxID=2716417 RepID=A0AAW9Q312_9CYAN|nr:VTT domain-containing protein [Tumidithrix elongata RA019]
MQMVIGQLISLLRSKPLKYFIAALFCTLLIASVLALRLESASLFKLVVSFLQSQPLIAPIIFILIYILATLALLPAMLLNLEAGVLWHPFWGSIFSMIGSIGGAVCAFLIARYLLKDYLDSKLRSPTWEKINQKVQKNAWEVVAFIRINPFLSIGPVNYLFGITSIPLSTYTWATAIFLAPPTIYFAILGNSIGNITTTGLNQSHIRDLIIISSAIALFLMLKILSKKIIGDRNV